MRGGEKTAGTLGSLTGGEVFLVSITLTGGEGGGGGVGGVLSINCSAGGIERVSTGGL